MRIALVGYGRMGRETEKAAVAQGHIISAVIDAGNMSDVLTINPSNTDVAIEFSTPSTAYGNVSNILRQGVPVVCGTTGWDAKAFADRYGKSGMLSCQETDVAVSRPGLIVSSNFSIGVNLFFALNKHLARLMQDKNYKPSITETHHIHKLDRPSGTAKTLGTILQAQGYEGVPTESIREGEVAGIHTVVWDSEADKLVLTHEAKSRAGFALGAVMAAEWLQGKTGVHTMAEVLGIEE